jgi:hypothetical protein
MAFNDRLNRVVSAAGRKSGADDAVANKRWAQRKSSQMPAGLIFPGTRNLIPCQVRDSSSTGAKLELTAPRNNPNSDSESMPDEFTLVVRMDNMEVDCEVVWRKGSMMGVRYVSPARVTPKAPTSGRR